MKIKPIRDPQRTFKTLSTHLNRSKEDPRFSAGLAKAYQPKLVEPERYEWWERNGYFKPKEDCSLDNVFSMVLPPPNVTGTLHLGHALTVTIQDTLARWQRMCGKSVVWVPGTDHAGIATQAVVEKTLQQKSGMSRHDLGREEFVQEIWKWRNEKGGRIKEQLKQIGASLDWSREYFTMDKGQSEAVAKTIIQLFEKGLIYRDKALVNWSCQLRSVISDIEVEQISISGPTPITVPSYKEPIIFGRLTDFAYKLVDKDEEIVVSTSRIETMLGDVAIAVHPHDTRYQHLHNAKVVHPITRQLIPIIFYEGVDPNFGTGAVKITPAHDHFDFEVARKHDLPLISVIDEQGNMSENCDQFSGMKRFVARQAVTEILGKLGLLRGFRDNNMQLPICSRSRDVVEFLLKPQWFLKCKDLAEIASAAVRDKKLIIEPEQFNDNWFMWLDNIKDWCISRQLWWGHQLPIYKCESEGKCIYVGALSQEEALNKSSQSLEGEIEITREPDVLDTWFSSALLPFTAFGWPDQNSQLDAFYPLSIMVTGNDILFFWVARMVMLGTLLTGKLPFQKVLLHGIICDSQGRKMSKSLGNVIEPEDIINGATLKDMQGNVEKSFANGILHHMECERAKEGLKMLFPNGIPECGTDALRFTLLSHKVKNHYISFNVNECHSNRLFCNKIWQAVRFALNWYSKLNPEFSNYNDVPETYSLMDKWILSELSIALNAINSAMSQGDFHLATVAIRSFLYNSFCDIYLEYCKPILNKGTSRESLNSCYLLLYCLNNMIRGMAPFMPYLAEELYAQLPNIKQLSIMHSEFPKSIAMEDLDLKKSVDFALEIVSEIRKLKLSQKIKNTERPEVWILTDKDLKQLLSVIEQLSLCGHITINSEPLQKTVSTVVSHQTKIYLSVQNYISNPETQIDINKKKRLLTNNLNKLLKMRSNDGYNKVKNEIRRAHSDKIMRLQSELKKLGSEENPSS